MTTAVPLDMDRVKIDPSWALRVPANLALRRKVLPFSYVDDCVHVACLDQSDVQSLQAVERCVELPIRPEVAEPESLERAIQRIFGGPMASRLAGNAPTPTRRGDEAEPEDAVAQCDELLHAAVLREASDVHIDPGPGYVRVRLRVDGVLEDYRRLPETSLNALISRIKVLARMDIAERRAPQDGRFSLPGAHGNIDIRAASLPTKHGERMTLRLLAAKTGELTLEKLGMGPADLQCFETAIVKPHGMILLTGPTGSGKSTTLYAAIRRVIDQRELNVLTIEDPVEYEIEGVAQVEVDSADKVSFSKALRSVLRHDPDVLMLGEIRDRETASVGIKAALTGHLVLSTLHTNSAASSITRLTDMGVEPYLVGATVRLAVAQRLVRRVCGQCRVPIELSANHAQILGNSDLTGTPAFTGRGCMYCAGRGYVGRLGLFSMIPVDETMSRAIATNCSEAELIQIARQRGIRSLVDDAIVKMREGLTTIDETLKAVTIW